MKSLTCHRKPGLIIAYVSQIFPQAAQPAQPIHSPSQIKLPDGNSPMRVRAFLTFLTLAICGCQSDGSPSLAVQALDNLFYPYQTHCYARKVKPGTTWTEIDGSVVRLGEDGQTHQVSGPVEPSLSGDAAISQ
ncbi:hypothetical protein SAMN05444166_3655 [Singulisphaera sp. GP187]|nr:hypothetical protein SAMN05444166_3655 [Singulisphaera sp. GP187]